MTYFARFITKFPRFVIFIFLLLLIGAIMWIPQVGVNENDADYLPDDSLSKQGLIILQEEFPHTMNKNAKIMIKDKTVSEVIELKNQIKQINGVLTVTWIDDVVDLNSVPMEYIPEGTRSLFYKDNHALLEIIFVENTNHEETKNAINEINVLLNGQGGIGYVPKELGGVVGFATIVAVLVIILILVLCTESYFATLLILITLGVAITFNFGTNIIFKEISDITYMAAAVIQLAVSVDYSLILMKNFKIGNEKFTNTREALIYSTRVSFKTILASSLTTVAGFLALGLMSYQIGAELGLVLAKGVLLSLITVVVLLPALLKVSIKLVDKTSHKSVLPTFSWLGKLIHGKVAIIAFILIIGLAVFGYIGQSQNKFTYSDNQFDYTLIEEEMIQTFGESNSFVLFVPKGDKVKELGLVAELLETESVKSVRNIYLIAGVDTPEEFIPEVLKAQFQSEKYSMIALEMNLPREGAETFNSVDQIRTIASKYYGESYLTGESAIIKDIKDVIEKDYFLVIIVSILSIALIILLTFKSITIPIVLILVIQSAIWINLAIPHYQGITLAFLGYILVSSIQLGATIDYAIIITEHYEEERKTLNKVMAARKAIAYSAQSIIISMLSLIIAGLSLSLMMDMDLVKELGFLISRGTLLSGFLSLLVLPQILIIFDRIIEKTTLNRKSK